MSTDIERLNIMVDLILIIYISVVTCGAYLFGLVRGRKQGRLDERRRHRHEARLSRVAGMTATVRPDVRSVRLIKPYEINVTTYRADWRGNNETQAR